MTVRLLPCPFCETEDVSLNEPNEFYLAGSINCPACLATMPGEVRGDDFRELIGCWNTRTDDRLRAELETSRKLCMAFEEAVGGDVGEILELRAELASARKALEFYANQYCEGLGTNPDDCGKFKSDDCGGCLAAAALGQPK